MMATTKENDPARPATCNGLRGSAMSCPPGSEGETSVLARLNVGETRATQNNC